MRRRPPGHPEPGDSASQSVAGGWPRTRTALLLAVGLQSPRGSIVAVAGPASCTLRHVGSGAEGRGSLRKTSCLQEALDALRGSFLATPVASDGSRGVQARRGRRHRPRDGVQPLGRGRLEGLPSTRQSRVWRSTGHRRGQKREDAPWTGAAEVISESRQSGRGTSPLALPDQAGLALGGRDLHPGCFNPGPRPRLPTHPRFPALGNRPPSPSRSGPRGCSAIRRRPRPW